MLYKKFQHVWKQLYVKENDSKEGKVYWMAQKLFELEKVLIKMICKDQMF